MVISRIHVENEPKDTRTFQLNRASDESKPAIECLADAIAETEKLLREKQSQKERILKNGVPKRPEEFNRLVRDIEVLSSLLEYLRLSLKK